MSEPSPNNVAETPLDVAELVRRPGQVASLHSWRPGAVMKSLWPLLCARPTALLGGLLTALLRAGVLLVVSAAVGQVVRGGDVWVWAGVAAAGLMAAAALGLAGQRIVIAAVQDGLTLLRERLVDRQLNLPVDVVLHHGAEGFVLAMTRDCELLGQMARACFGTLLPGAALVLLCLGGIALIMPVLVWPLVLVLAVLWLVRRRLSQRLAAQMGSAHAAIDQLYEQLGGAVLRHELAVSHANEAQERAACGVSVTHTHALTRELAGMQAGATEVDALVLGLSLLGLLVWVSTAGGAATSGPNLAAVLFLLLALRSALQGALGALQEMARGVPALAGIEYLLAMPPAPAHEGTVTPTRWRVTLEGASRHVAGRALIRNVDLALEPGRITVLTGQNGAGKTTLLRLLLGLGEADGGTVRVDGVPWAQIDRAAFRRGVGYLPQNPVLFAGTVGDNIAYAAPDVTHKTLQAVAQAVGLRAELSMRLGPGGNPLSGGERQRIALARVLLRQPRMLVLDEPTNHLDAASASALITLVRQMPGEPAVLVVSHDPALIAQADQVLEMRDGCVLARAVMAGQM